MWLLTSFRWIKSRYTYKKSWILWHTWDTKRLDYKLFKDRAQYVQIDSHMSEQSNIKCTIRQGPILGPMIYLIYVNDIANSTTTKVMSLQTYISDANTENLFHKVNIEINKLYDWFCSNRLCLNAKKTKYMIIRSPHNKCDLTGHNVLYKWHSD